MVYWYPRPPPAPQRLPSVVGVAAVVRPGVSAAVPCKCVVLHVSSPPLLFLLIGPCVRGAAAGAARAGVVSCQLLACAFVHFQRCTGIASFNPSPPAAPVAGR